ncbi:MAG: HNH endonuclease signature motif containing protein [Microthrixaceae bacterium]
MRLELSGHNAVGAQRIINEETERQRRAAQRESESTGAPVPEAPVLRARAVMELLRRGAHANPQSPRPAVEAILPITVDRHGRPTSVQSVDGHSLDEFTAAPLICDAILQPVITDTSGAPLRLGRATRLFTKPQRAALVTRDGGCVFPGCDQPASRCDAHHEHPWELGGRTDVDNGCLLCRRHHGLVHCSNPWVLQHLQVDELPPELAESHWARATSAGLDPSRTVRVWRSPDGRLHLAQNAADRAGPAPPRRAAA